MVYSEPVRNAIAVYLMFVTDWEYNVWSFCFSFKGTGFWQHIILLTSDCLTSPTTNIFQQWIHPYPSWEHNPCAMDNYSAMELY